jgi:hypothetical protein
MRLRSIAAGLVMAATVCGCGAAGGAPGRGPAAGAGTGAGSAAQTPAVDGYWTRSRLLGAQPERDWSPHTPVTCLNWTSQQSARQVRFACGGFFGGTSGSPWVTRFDPRTRTGTIVGVIGGFQEGGATDAISYSAYLNGDIRELYEQAGG